MQSGANYLITVTPPASSITSVSGTATLGGTVFATFASGIYAPKSYDILHASAISGTFQGLTASGIYSFTTTLQYTATDVFLDMRAALGAGTSLNQNQQKVADSINEAFNSAGTLPPAILRLFGLTGSDLGKALSSGSGEPATTSEQTAFSAMSQFIGLLTDPFTASGGASDSSGSAPAFADETGALAYVGNDRKKLPAERDAFAMFTKAPSPTFEQRWSVWASAFGGSQTTNGNLAAGSNDTTSRIFGTAVGADYLFSPRTIGGFALAGGGTFSVNGLGYGRSDLFQAGAYVRHSNGPAYMSAALAYGWQDVTTDRTVTIAGVDRLRAELNANAFSGRVEGGYRFVARWLNGSIGITPYAAGQFTTFDLPAYLSSPR